MVRHSLDVAALFGGGATILGVLEEVVEEGRGAEKILRLGFSLL